MSRRMKLGPIVIAALVVSATAMAVWGQQAAPPAGAAVSPVKCLPPDTLAYAEIPDYEASKARFEQTALYKIWSEPQIQDFLAPLRAFLSEQIAGGTAKFQAEVGVPFDDLRNLFSGHMAAALMSITPPKQGESWERPDAVEAAIFLTPRDPAALKPLVAALQAYLNRSAKNTTVQTTRHGDVEVTQIVNPLAPTAPCFAHAWLGPTFVLTIGSREKTLPALLARWKGENPDSLAANPLFLAARKRLEAATTEFFAYIAVRDILRQLDSLIAPDLCAPLEAAGVYGINSVSYKLIFDGPAMREITYLHTGPERRGFVAALSPAPLDEKLLDLIPADATGFMATRVNVPLLWQSVDAFAKSFGEKSYLEFRRFVERLSATADMDIEKEVIPAFGDYAILYSVPTGLGAMMFGIFDWVAVVGVKDTEKAAVVAEMVRLKTTEMWEGKLPQADPQDAVKWQSLNAGNTTLNFVSIPGAPFVGLSPGYALVADKAVIAFSLQSLQSAVARLAAAGPGIRTRPDFAAAYPKIPRGGGVIAYSDLKANYPTLHTTLAMMLPAFKANLDRAQPGAAPAFDMVKFPPADVVVRHLFGSISAMRSEDDGVSFESHAVLNASPPACAALIAAIPIPNLLRSRMAANEATAIGSLKTLSTQQAIFRQQAEVDQNGNGLGEYGLLGEMAGEIALRPATARTAQPAYIAPHYKTAGSAGNGNATRSGYHYRIYLASSPTSAGDDAALGGTPQTGGKAADPAAVALQERHFALYAWPAEPRPGARAFFVNEVGEVYATRMEAKVYAGPDGPAADAAYTATVFTSPVSSGGKPGCDGNQWQPTAE